MTKQIVIMILVSVCVIVGVMAAIPTNEFTNPVVAYGFKTLAVLLLILVWRILYVATRKK